MILLDLFLSFAQIGLFSIGGGYAALPLIKNQVVEVHAWLTLSEFADVLTISQMTPGPIAINTATFVGTRVSGLAGAVAATLGCITPSFIIVLTLAYVYVHYKELVAIKGALSTLRPAIVSLIASAGASVVMLVFWGGAVGEYAISKIDFIAVGLFVAGLLVLRVKKPNPIIVMTAAGVIGGGIYLLRG